MDPILERIIDLGIGITKVHIKGKIEEQKLHDELENVIKEQRKYNELCTIGEGIDFEGLVDYIKSNFIDEKREVIGCFQLLLLFFHGLIISQPLYISRRRNLDFSSENQHLNVKKSHLDVDLYLE